MKQEKKDIFWKFWRNMTATRPMWGMIPARILFGVVLILQGLNRYGFERHDAAIINDFSDELAIGIISAFALIEIIAGILAVPGVGMRFVAFAIIIETVISIFLERPFLPTGDTAHAQILLFGLASLMFFSGAGRYSIDRWMARKLLKKYPCKIRETYCLAETPFYKW